VLAKVDSLDEKDNLVVGKGTFLSVLLAVFGLLLPFCVSNFGCVNMGQLLVLVRLVVLFRLVCCNVSSK